MTTKKTASPRPMGIYYIEGDERSFETAITALIGLGGLETPDGATPYVSMQTTQGKDIQVLKVTLPVVQGLQSWNRRAKEGNVRFIFTVYQLLSNNLLRPFKEKTLKDEAPVKKVRNAIKNLPKRSALAARR